MLNQHGNVYNNAIFLFSFSSRSSINRPTRNQILRQCKYLIRKLEYEEIARADPMRALGYLQTRLNDIINHEDGKELSEFHKLASLLFKPVDAPGDTDRLAAVVSPLPLAPPSPDTSSMDDDDDDDEEGENKDGKPSHVAMTVSMADRAERANKEAAAGPSNAEQQIMIKSQRCLLYNRLVELMPDQILCQPKGNLSDLVVI